MPDDARIKALEASIARDERIAALEASIAQDEGATRFESPGLDPAAVDAAMGQAVEQRRAQQAWEERTRPARRIMEWKSRAESEPSGYRRPGFNPSAMPDPPPETITEGVGNVIGHGLTTAIEAPVEQFKSAAYKAGYGETRPDDISGEQDTQGAFADAARGLMSLLPPVAALTASRAAQVKAMQEAQAEGVTPNAFARAVDAGNTGFEGAMHHAIDVGERQLPYLVADAVQRTGLTDMTSEEVAKARSPIGGLLMEVLPFGLLGTKRAITERFGGEGKVSAPRAGTPAYEMQRARSQPAPKIGEIETRRMERMAARERFRTESENPQAWLPKEKRGDPPPLRTEPPIAPVPKPKPVVPILPPQTPVTTSNPSKALPGPASGKVIEGKAEAALPETAAPAKPEPAPKSKLKGTEPDPLAEQARGEAGTPKPIEKPKPFTSEPAEINQRKWYHGTRTEGLTAETLDATVTRGENLMGNGVYFTDDPSIARSYATGRKGRGGKSTVYEADLDVQRPLVAEDAAPADVRAVFERAREGLSDYTENIDAALAKSDTPLEGLIKAIKEDLAEMNRDEVGSYGDAVQVMQDLGGTIADLGYDAITHVGGKRVGNKTHQVVVLLDPSNAGGVANFRSPVRGMRAAPEFLADPVAAAIEQPKPVPEATAPKAAEAPDPRIQGVLDTMNKEKGGDGTVTLRSTPIDEMFMSVAKPVAKLGERVYDAVDAQLAKRVTEPVFNKVGAALEKSSKGRKLKAAADWAFRDPARVISEEFAAEVAKGRGAKDLARLDAGQTGKSLGESLRGVPEATRREVYRYMNSERADLPSGLTDAQRLVIDSSVKEIQSITRDLVSEGILSPEAADQFARYLPRLYEDSLMSRPAFAARREFRAGETFTRTDKHLARMKQGDISHEQFRELAKANGGFAVTRKGKVIQAKFETAKQRRDFLGKLDTERRAQILTDLDIPFRRTRSGAIRPDFGKTTAAKRDAYQRRVGGDPVLSRRGVARENPLPDEVREMLGEVTDPAEAAAYAVQAGKARLAVHRFFKAVEKGGDANGRWVFPDEVSAPDGAVLLGEKWAGPLKGKWVREDVARFLKDVHGIPSGLSEFNRALLAQWKSNKTRLSPRTAFRQAMAVPQQLHMAGINVFNPNNWATLREAFRALNPEHPMHRVMIENQIIRGSLPSHEIRILERHLDGRGSIATKLGQALANPLMLSKKARMAQEWMGQKYNIPDAFVRATTFIDRMSKGWDVKGATVEVNRYTNNYGTVGRGVRWASDNPLVSPFIRFQAETARNLVNAIHYHPLRALTAMFHTKAFRALMGHTALSLMTEDDWEALDNERGGLELPLGIPFMGLENYNEKGNFNSFDMRYADIFGNWIPQPDKPGEDDPIKDAMGALGITGSPGAEVISALVQLGQGEDVEDYRNHVFAREGQTWDKRALGFNEFYWKSMLPTWTPFLGHQYNVVEAAAKDEQLNPYTPKQSLIRAILSAFFGLNTREFDPTREMDKLSYQERKRKSALKAQANEGYDSKDAMKRTATEARDRRRVLVKARKASRERAKMK